jgi:tRNA G18 (ribose-2'-O)-methylase SpoU
VATATTDYAAVRQFLDAARLRECFSAPPHAFTWLAETVPYITLDVLAGPGTPLETVLTNPSCQVLVSGWDAIEGVLAYAPEPEFDADLRVVIAATNERALRDLLLALPPGPSCFCYVAGAWMLPTIAELLDGVAMPAREGYWAREAPMVPQVARQLGADDYSVVANHWSADVWQEVLALGYAVFAAADDAGLQALCFHWPITAERHEVHGLQAVRDGGGAKAVFTAATADVVRQGKIATCTAVLSDDALYLQALTAAGYQRHYRVESFLGVCRGSRQFVPPEPGVFFRTPGPPVRQIVAPAPGEGRILGAGKDPLVVQLRELGTAAGRRERGACVAEGLMLARRALDDRLLVRALVYSPALLRDAEGVTLLRLARERGIDHYRASDGLMGTLTATRPLPSVLAVLEVAVRDAATLRPSTAAMLLVADGIQNPDNLGMLLRTADATGVEAIVVAHGIADPLHKSCVRAARGAVGRIPIFESAEPASWLADLADVGFQLLGATTHKAAPLFDLTLARPLAIVVGNEQAGLSPAVLECCTARVALPMAPGQDSLNVGVAAGVLLYEALRQRRFTSLTR